MNILDKARLLQTSVLSGLLMTMAVPAFAQVADEDLALAETVVEDDEVAEADELVVTGSRIRRDSFTSTSPLQVITAETVVDLGLTSTADIVKSQTVISGVQLDENINSSFVTNGGPGASNVSLRGLGEDRTLVLVNGRRFAPAGVEGAPSLPDLNLIPSSLVARVDTLLDGASSVYGSDAIAGVVNVILRDEFDGFRVDGSVTHPFESGGGTRRISGLMGSTGEKGKFIAAVEYRQQDELDFQDRDWQYGDEGLACQFDVEVEVATGREFRNCRGAVGNAEFISFTSPLGDGDLTGFADPDAGFRGISSSRLLAFRSSALEAEDNLFSDAEALTAYVAADRELQFLGDKPTSVFFETSFSNSQTNVRNGFHGQIFPTVPNNQVLNPFIDFGRFGIEGAVPVIFSPIKRSDIDVDVTQYRMTAGLEGEVSWLDDWSYETYASYSRSVGDSVRPVVLEDRLALSLTTSNDNDGDGIITCGLSDPNGGNDVLDRFGFLTLATCVPINFFAPSLYDPVNPQFATQAEFDYLRGERSVTTKVDQTVLSGFFTGPIFDMPGKAGEVQAVIGAEYRVDGLDSGTDTIASTGGAAGFFADRRSVGQVSQFEAFAELDVPLLSGLELAEDLSVNLSGRLVDNEFYPTEAVYSLKGSYSPVDWLTFSATYGTSYRSPGARELFLGGQSGFVGGGNDPCLVPFDARNDDDDDPTTPAVYDPSGDDRDPIILTNCRSEGIDPTTLGIAGSASIEAFRSGNRDLDPETSTSQTFGVRFSQPFTDAFDLLFSASYFKIDVDDAPSVPSAGFILNECYSASDFPTNPFCQRRVRDSNTGFLTEIDQTPFNLATFGAEGVDFNARASFDFNAFDREFTFQTDGVLTHQFGREFQNIEGAPLEDAAGSLGFPKWRGNLNSRLRTGDFSFFWGSRYIGAQTDFDTQTGEVFTPGVNAFDGFTGDPSTPRGVDANDNPLGVVIDDIGDYWRHDVSVRYDAGDSWGIVVGINNVFDRDPPLLDPSAGTTLVGNVPAGIGYDVRGRSLFVTASKTF